MLVEQWDDAIQRQVDSDLVVRIYPKPEENLITQHCHPGFGRAEPWRIEFRDGTTLDINGCPLELEKYKKPMPA